MNSFLASRIINTRTKSPFADSTLFSITSHGTNKSLLLTTAKSDINSEPTIDAQEFGADTPGTTSTCSPSFGSHPPSFQVS